MAILVLSRSFWAEYGNLAKAQAKKDQLGLLASALEGTKIEDWLGY